MSYGPFVVTIEGPAKSGKSGLVEVLKTLARAFNFDLTTIEVRTLKDGRRAHEETITHGKGT